MTKKKKLLITLGLLIIVAAIYLAVNTLQQTDNPVEKAEKTYTVQGKVVTKTSGCGRTETLQADGTVRREVSGICDGGDSISIDGEHINTSAGATRWKSSKSSIGNIYPGDKVEVRYIVGEHNTKSTNCETCYVKLLQSTNNGND